MAHDVFVSYSPEDKAVADTIVASLEKEGIRCWYAPRDIRPSEPITRAIRDSRIMVLVFSSNANDSRRVLDELNFAIAKELTILPFRIENLDPKGPMMLHLSSRHWLDAYDPTWEAHIQKLVRNVSSNLGISLKKEKEAVEKEEIRAGKRKKLLIRIAASTAAALLAAAGWFGLPMLMNDGAGEETAQPSPQATETTANTPTADATAAAQADREYIAGLVGEECEIAFTSRQEDPDGFMQIFKMRVDGSGLQQLTDEEAEHINPTWSPTGEKIAFILQRKNGPGQLAVSDQDGSNQVILTDEYDPHTDSKLEWSPDGEEIVYHHYTEIALARLNGENERGITGSNILSGPYEKFMPDWQQSGEKIALVSSLLGNADIFVLSELQYIDIKEHDPHLNQLTSTESDELYPTWSPDGSYIAYVLERSGLEPQLMVMDENGENIRRLHHTISEGTSPAWSPDGTKVLFVSDEDGDNELMVVNADGTGKEKLTDNNRNDDRPVWSPGGKLIAFVSDIDGDEEIYMKEAGGERLIQLTFNDEADLDPDWSPLCK